MSSAQATNVLSFSSANYELNALAGVQWGLVG